jgi:glutamate transport system substrate-binding protein
MRTSIAFCLVGAVAGTGLYVGNLAFLASQPAGDPLADPLRIGVSSDLPGWELMDQDQRSGFAVDLADWLADDLHHTVEFVDVSPFDRERALADEQVQMVFDAYSITADRRERVLFAGPIMLTGQGLMTRTDQIRTVEDISDERICVSQGTNAADHLSTIIAADLSSCVHEMQTGNVDAVLDDQILLLGMAEVYDYTVSVVPFSYQTRYGIGLKHGNIDACNEVRDSISRFVTSGAWDDAFLSNIPDAPAAAGHKPDPNDLDLCE